MKHIFVADDGREFNTQEECETYEDIKTKYWAISINPDCNETGSLQNLIYVKTIWEGHLTQQGNHEHEILEDICYEQFGKRTAWVQGVAPCENWKIKNIKKEDFENAVPIMWGGHKTETRIMVLGVGNKGKVNVFSDNIKK